MGQLTVNVPGTPQGEPIEVPPFGIIPNGSTVALDDEALDNYEQYMRYLSGDPEFEIDDDIVVGDAEAELPPAIPEEEHPVEALPSPGPVSTGSEPEPKDGE